VCDVPAQLVAPSRRRAGLTMPEPVPLSDEALGHALAVHFKRHVGQVPAVYAAAFADGTGVLSCARCHETLVEYRLRGVDDDGGGVT